MIGKCPIALNINGQIISDSSNQSSSIHASIKNLIENNHDHFFIRLFIIAKMEEENTSEEFAKMSKKRKFSSNHNQRKHIKNGNSSSTINKKRHDLSCEAKIVNNYICKEYCLNFFNKMQLPLEMKESSFSKIVQNSLENSFTKEFSFNFNAPECKNEYFIKANSIKEINVPKLKFSHIHKIRIYNISNEEKSKKTFHYSKHNNLANYLNSIDQKVSTGIFKFLKFVCFHLKKKFMNLFTNLFSLV